MKHVDVSILACHIFHGLSSTINRMRLWLGIAILPKDISKFSKLILSKMAQDIEKMDSEKRSKITAIKVDFEFRD